MFVVLLTQFKSRTAEINEMILLACDRCDLLITCVLMVQSRVMTPVALSGFEDHK